MCGRIANTLPSDAMARLFEAAPANLLPEVPNYNICPTDMVHVVMAGEGGRALKSMRWGFIPRWYKSPSDGPLLINARAESIAEKPAFRDACRARRCIVPATGYYEWTKDAEGARLPWYISRGDGAPLAFAAIWQDWGEGEARAPTCAIVTTGAGDGMARLHHREPVVLSREDWALWLGEAGHGAAPLMRPTPEGALQFWRVDRAVNSNRAEGPELIEEIEA